MRPRQERLLDPRHAGPLKAGGAEQEVTFIEVLRAPSGDTEDKFSRVAAYDWFGSVVLVPLATALAGPAETAFGRTSALWGCAALVVVVTAAVLCVPDVRDLRRRTKHVSASDRVGSADAESAVGGLG